MKQRLGFISNSSSSSFVVGPSDLEHLALYSIKCYNVKDIIDSIAYVKNAIKEMEEDMPVFIWQEFSWLGRHYDDLICLEERRPGCYITEEFDRDEAYSEGFTYEIFETDL